MTDMFPVLYILARNDMASLNPGKLAAQCSHASNAFVHDVQSNRPEDPMFAEWQAATSQGFGTVLTLAVNQEQMRTAAEVAVDMGLCAGIVHDPTYPLIDGETVHFIPVDTCAYIFADKNDPMTRMIVGKFSLYP